MIRVFVDANILFSAAYKATSRIKGLWSNESIRLVASEQVLTEATRNLGKKHPEAVGRLNELVPFLEVTDEKAEIDADLVVAKDLHVLASAIGSKCDYLVTGDHAHFAHLVNVPLEGLTVLSTDLALQLFTRMEGDIR